ncbi:MAG: putative DNA binding domain-containing protein [Candidatus Omnitrophica bacterium]|nr:putative DNA binding domain-containing protein [Candidatus Omnitrophota bacterium]
MKMKPLSNIIGKHETEAIEWKTSLSQINEIINTVVAFSNTKGGKVFVGVSKSGQLLGVQIGKDSIERLTNQISQHTDPKVHPRITTRNISEKEMIVIDVTRSADKLTLAFGRPYIRVGKSTMKMSKDEYERLILEKHKEKLQFDKQICDKAGLKDIDWEFVKKEFIPLYEKSSGKKIAGTPESLLESLGCVKNSRPTNAGIILFGKDPQRFFMNAYIALARYGTEDVDVKRLDYKEFTGNLFQQIDNCSKYIKDNISAMSQLRKGRIQREDIPEYGWFSIRELITNAVCHRDYSNIGTKVIIKMFSNRIEFYNPGGLQKGITPKNIAEMQFSRNPIIAKILAKVEYIEELGEGWNKILKEHKEHPLRPKLPIVQTDDYAFLVNIYSTKDKFVEQEEAVDLSERQKKIISYLKTNKKINTTSCAHLLDISNDTALRELASLKSKGLIVKKGIGRATYYALK